VVPHRAEFALRFTVATGEEQFRRRKIYGEGVLNCTITAARRRGILHQDSTFFIRRARSINRAAGPMIGALAVNRSAGKNNILARGVRGRGSAIASGCVCSADKGSTWTLRAATALTNGAAILGRM